MLVTTARGMLQPRLAASRLGRLLLRLLGRPGREPLPGRSPDDPITMRRPAKASGSANVTVTRAERAGAGRLL